MDLDFAVGNEKCAAESDRLRRRVEALGERLANGAHEVAIPLFACTRERNAALRLHVDQRIRQIAS